MSIADTIKAIQAGLQPWCAQYGGSVLIAHDVPHLFKIMGEQPGAVRAAVLFAGESARDPRLADVTGRVDIKFWIGFSRGYTLESYKGKSLVDGIAGGAPMFQIIYAAKQLIRPLLIGTPDEPVPYYLGTELLTFEGVTLDAYRIEISVTSDLGDPVDQSDSLAPET